MPLIPENKKGKIRLFVILALIAFVALVVRLLVDARISGSAITYVAIPFGVAMTLLFLTSRSQSQKWYLRYWNLVRDSLIVLLSSSIILFEGFICVLMFIPIYVFLVTLVFIIIAISESVGNKSGPMVSVLPFLVLISSLEGTTENLSFETYNEVEVTRKINLGVEDIKANLTRKREYQSPIRGIMSIFPPPVLFAAESLQENQIHTVDYQYNRWFFANSHEGSLTVRLVTVDENLIETEVLEDTSYIATYLKIHGTRIIFTPIDENITKVTLKISFDRLLHPAWYFQPLERYGVKVMGESILTQLVAGENET